MGEHGGTDSKAEQGKIPRLLIFVLFLAASFFLNRSAFSVFPVTNSLALINTNFSDFINSLTASWSFGGNLWRPFLVASFALDKLLFGDYYPGFYIQQLLLNGLCAYLIFSLTLRVCKDEVFAVLGGIIFILLPIHHENIFWLAGRGHLLALSLMLASMGLYLKSLDDNSKISKYTSLILAFFAMLSHESAYLLPLFLLAAIPIAQKDINKQSIAKSLQQIIPAVLLCVMTLIARSIILGGTGSFEIQSGLAETNLISGFWKNLFADAQNKNGVLAAFFQIILSGSFMFVIYKMIRERKLYRKFIFTIIWLLSFFPFIFAESFAASYLLTASISVALALSAILSYLYRSQKHGPAKKIVAALFLAVMLLIAVEETHTASLDWIRSGEITANLKSEFARLSEHMYKKHQIVVGMPEKIGKARTNYNYLSQLANTDKQNLIVNSVKSFDEHLLDQYLSDRQSDSQYWIRHKGELRQLVKEPTRVDSLRFEFSNCRGEVTIKQFDLQRSGSKGSFNDFSRWKITGDAKLVDKNRLQINSENISLTPPKSGAPILDKMQSLVLQTAIKTKSQNCKLNLSVKDRKSPVELATRELVLDLSRQQNWRISGYHTAIRTWFNHIAAIQYVTEFSKIEKLPETIVKQSKFAHFKEFAKAEYVEKISFVSSAIPPAENARVLARILLTGKQKNQPETLKEISMTSARRENRYSAGFDKLNHPTKFLLIGASKNAIGFTLKGLEIFRPVNIPQIHLLK